jgi:hypothetical protein
MSSRKIPQMPDAYGEFLLYTGPQMEADGSSIR